MAARVWRSSSARPRRVNAGGGGRSGGVSCGAGCRRRAAAQHLTGRVISRKRIGRPGRGRSDGWLAASGLRVRQRRLKAPEHPQRLSSLKRYWRCWHQYAEE